MSDGRVKGWLIEEKKGFPSFGAPRWTGFAMIVLTALLIAGTVYRDNEWLGTVMPSLPVWWFILGYWMGKHDERKKHEAAPEETA